MTIICVNDSRPVADGAWCATCAENLEDALGEVPALDEALAVAITRQARTTRRTGPRSSEKPLPYGWSASHAAASAKNTLVTWARIISEERGIEIDCPDSLTDVAQWLIGPQQGTKHLEWLRHRAEAPEAYSELMDACKYPWRVVDAPAEREHVGTCDHCGYELWVPKRDKDRPPITAARCRACGTEHDIFERRQRMLPVHADEIWTAARICMVLDHAGLRVTLDMVSGWKSRHRIAVYPPVEWDRHRVARFRFGDVLERLAEGQRRNGGAA